jgi:hypothetical protein
MDQLQLINKTYLSLFNLFSSSIYLFCRIYVHMTFFVRVCVCGFNYLNAIFFLSSVHFLKKLCTKQKTITFIIIFDVYGIIQE